MGLPAATGSGNFPVTDGTDTTGTPGNQVFFQSDSPSSTIFAGFTGNVIIGQGGNIQIRNSTVASLGSGTVDINYGGILSSDKGNAYSTGINNPIVLSGGSLATQGASMNYSGGVAVSTGTTSYIGDYSGGAAGSPSAAL